MKKRVTLIALLSCLTMSLLGGISGALSWFQEKAVIDDQSRLVGESQGAYFARGEGTELKPFIINRPIHLYNLAWLQYIGYFNTSDAPFYFALDPEDGIDTLDMTGWVLPPIGTSLYPFIGNFNGNNETIANLVTENKVGDGHIEKKPTIINKDAVDSNGVLKVYQKTGDNHFLNTAVDVVGFFGIVGDYSGMADVDADYSSNNKITNVALDNLTVASSSAKSLGGIGVGYMNASVSGMGISDSSISFANGTSSLTDGSNLSDYSTVGYAAPAYRGNLSTQKTYAVVPDSSSGSGTGGEGGDGRDWGGSIDFKYIFNRLDNLYENRAEKFWRGVFSEYTTTNVSRSYVGGLPRDTRSSATTTTTYYDGATSANPASFDSNLLVFDRTHDQLNSYDPLEGEAAYHKVNTSSSDDYDYQYLFGGKKDYPEFKKRIETTDRVTFATEEVFSISTSVTETNTNSFAGYSISIGGTYMNYSNGQIVAGNSATTSWAFVNGNDSDVTPSSLSSGYIFTIDSSNQQRYYLRAPNYSSVNLTTDKALASTWSYNTYNRNNYLRTRISNTYYYLRYTNNAFSLNNSRSSTFAFSSSSNLSETTTSTFTAYLNGNQNGTTYGMTSDTRWIIQQKTGGEIIYTMIGGVPYYLTSSGTSLDMTSSSAAASLWNRTNGILSTVAQSEVYYATWSNGYKLTTNSAEALTLSFERRDDPITDQNKTYKTYSISYTWTYSTYWGYYTGRSYLRGTTTGVQHYTSSFSWLFENDLGESGRIFFLSGSTPYYLRYYNGNLSVTNNASLATVWNTNASGTQIWATDGSTNRYIGCTGSASNNTATWGITNGSSPIIVTSVSTSGATIPGETESTVTWANNGVKIPETYVPLVTTDENNHKATVKNYGYIVSGSNSVSDSGLTMQSGINEGSDYGDIRIAKYPIGNIHNSVTGGTEDDFSDPKTTSYCNGMNLGIIGRSYLSDGYVHITDDDFDTGSQGTSNLPQTKMNYEDMGLEKYKDSRGITGYQEDQSTGLRKLLANQTGIFGLHYVEGLVDADNTFIADKVIMDGETINNYEITRDSIDFYLHDSGFINFFAHTGYYNTNGPTNDSFFDLYEIDRTTAADNSSSKIDAIKRIQTIYGKLDSDTGRIDFSTPYVYVYDNGNTSDSTYNSATALTNAGYSAIFEMSWINDYSPDSELTRNWKNKALYYFEIPVNEGEYALGAVNGAQGAYLIYLDLGGNAMKYSYTNFTEYMKTEVYSFQYPLGVAVIQNSGSGDSKVKDNVNAANSVAIAINAAETVSFEKTGNSISVDYDASKSSVTFIGVNLIMTKAGTDPPVTVTAEASLTKTIEYFRYTSVAYNLTLKRYELTELTKTVTTPTGGTATTTYSGRTSLTEGASWVNMTTANATQAINSLNSGSGIGDASDNAIIVLFATAVPYNENETLGDTPIAFLIQYDEVIDGLNRYQNLIGYNFTVNNPSSSYPLTITVLSVMVEEGSIVYQVEINGITVTITLPQSFDVPKTTA